MDFILIGLVAQLAIFFLAPPAVQVYSITKVWIYGIAAPSSNSTDVPSSLASNVPIIEDSCPVSDFISALWSCPSATATATATAARAPVFSHSYIPKQATLRALATGLPDTDSLGTAAFTALVVALIFWYAHKLWQVKGTQRPVDPPEESLLSCWDSILNGTYYDLFTDQVTLRNFALFKSQESENLRSQIAAEKRKSDAAERAHQDQIFAKERAHQKEIDDINSEKDEEIRGLHFQITAILGAHQDKIDNLNDASNARESKLQAQIVARERAHRAEIDTINTARDARERQLLESIRTEVRAHKENIAARERSYKKDISDMKARRDKKIADVEAHAHNQRRRLYIETEKRKESENRCHALVKAGMLASVPSESTAETSPQDVAPTSPGVHLTTPAAAVSSIAQDAAPDSGTDQLLLAPAEAESLTREAEEASPTEAASRATTPEQDSTEPKAETSPQDVSHGAEGQLPSPPAATEGLTRETKEGLSAEPASPASIPTPNLDSAEPTTETSPQDVAPGIESQITSPPAANSSPITEAEYKLPAETEGLSEAESTSPPKSGTEQGHEQVQEERETGEEPRNSGMPLPEPFSLGEGVAQIPQDQEKGLAQDAPVPTEEQAASLQLTEPEAAPGPATSEDGASEAPVATEVEPEEPTGDRETEEPGAVEESAEAHVITASDGLEMSITEEGEQLPPASADESADGMDEEDDSPPVEATLKHYHASANGSESVDEAGASESLSSPPASRAGVIDLDDKMADALPDEATSPDDMDVEPGEGNVGDTGAGQSDSIIETPSDARMDVDTTDDAANDSRMDDDGNDDATNATGSQPIDMGDTEMSDPLHQDCGNNQGLPPQINDTPLLKQGVQPVNNGSGASSGPIRWNFSRAPTFQRPWKIPQPAQQPLFTQQAPAHQVSRPTRPPTPPAPQPTPRPGTQTSPPLASTTKDWPLERAKAINTWAVHVNSVSWRWINSPEFTGLDGATFQQARNDPNSHFSKTILEAEMWAKYMETNLKNELKQSPLSSGAQTVFRYMLPAVRKMREQYGVLSQSKGRPHLFVALLGHIDCILRELSVLVPESPTPPAQPQQPQRPRVVNNTLLKKKPLDAAKEILDFVEDGKSKCSSWEPRLQDGGTDAESFQKMTDYSLSPLWEIVKNMSHAADYLEHEGKTSRTPGTDSLYLSRVLQPAERMRMQYEDLGTLKKCPRFFKILLGHVDRVLVQLRELEKSSTPPAQSTQQVPSQPTPQTAGTEQRPGNPLHTYKNPLQAAIAIKECVQAIEQTYLLWEPNHRRDRQGKITKRGTDGDDFVHWHNDPRSRFSEIINQIRWIADWLENRGERFLESEVMLREQVKPLVQTMGGHYNHLGGIKGSVHLFRSMMRDIGRILKELDKIN